MLKQKQKKKIAEKKALWTSKINKLNNSNAGAFGTLGHLETETMALVEGVRFAWKVGIKVFRSRPFTEP